MKIIDAIKALKGDYAAEKEAHITHHDRAGRWPGKHSSLPRMRWKTKRERT